MKRLLLQLEREHPGVKASLLKALGNVMPRHLLDRRLNPSRRLARRVHCDSPCRAGRHVGAVIRARGRRRLAGDAGSSDRRESDDRARVMPLVVRRPGEAAGGTGLQGSRCRRPSGPHAPANEHPSGRMKAVLQRVTAARVTVADREVGAIGRGIVALVGVEQGDGPTDIEYIARKIRDLRIFEDAEGRMNLSLGDVDGAVLAVSQFTLLADCRKGRRPSFLRGRSAGGREGGLRGAGRAVATRGRDGGDRRVPGDDAGQSRERWSRDDPARQPAAMMAGTGVQPPGSRPAGSRARRDARPPDRSSLAATPPRSSGRS